VALLQQGLRTGGYEQGLDLLRDKALRSPQSTNVALRGRLGSKDTNSIYFLQRGFGRGCPIGTLYYLGSPAFERPMPRMTPVQHGFGSCA
jgi:hypothetical protein